MKDDIFVMRIAGMAVAEPVGGPEMQFHRAFQQSFANGYPGVPEIRPLVCVGIAGEMDDQGFAAFGCQFPVVEIAICQMKCKRTSSGLVRPS